MKSSPKRIPIGCGEGVDEYSVSTSRSSNRTCRFPAYYVVDHIMRYYPEMGELKLDAPIGRESEGAVYIESDEAPFAPRLDPDVLDRWGDVITIDRYYFEWFISGHSFEASLAQLRLARYDHQGCLTRLCAIACPPTGDLLAVAASVLSTSSTCTNCLQVTPTAISLSINSTWSKCNRQRGISRANRPLEARAIGMADLVVTPPVS